MKGGDFDITLVSPEPDHDPAETASELEALADRFIGWRQTRRGKAFPLTRMRHLFSNVPVPIATQRSAPGARLVANELAKRPDVAVFDFAHAAVLAPPRMSTPSVMFTHNVEAEIFRRHMEVTKNPLIRGVWRNQFLKMLSYERRILNDFDVVVAVSERDRDFFVFISWC